MDSEVISNDTSLEDKIEDFADYPTRDILAEGIANLLRPTVEGLDQSIRDTKQSQAELGTQIEALTSGLKAVAENQTCPVDLEPYIKKLLDAKRRVTVISSVLQTSQDRLVKVHQLAQKDIARRKSSLDVQTFVPAP